MKTLLVATGNQGKIRELHTMLGEFSFQLASLNDFPLIVEVPETGDTFEDNARLKAAGYALQTGLPALADDSGLEVMALDGRPGVLSARYGGDETTFVQKMEMLLEELRESGSEDRSARFVSSIAIASAEGKIVRVETGICDGTLALFPRGKGGFGYDPLFIPNGFDQTFGELSDAIKAKISHRAVAFSQIIPFLRHFMAI